MAGCRVSVSAFFKRCAKGGNDNKSGDLDLLSAVRRPRHYLKWGEMFSASQSTCHIMPIRPSLFVSWWSIGDSAERLSSRARAAQRMSWTSAGLFVH